MYIRHISYPRLITASQFPRDFYEPWAVQPMAHKNLYRFSSLTTLRCNSSNCFSSTGEGAFISRSIAL